MEIRPPQSAEQKGTLYDAMKQFQIWERERGSLCELTPDIFFPAMQTQRPISQFVRTGDKIKT